MKVQQDEKERDVPVEQLKPTCNLSTVRDGRGGIFTWIPPEPIREFNLINVIPGQIRGMHYHEHFVEYMLFISGEGVVITRDDPADPDIEDFVHVTKGDCLRIPTGVMHTVYAITMMAFVGMLTRPWDECDPPIVQVETRPRQVG